MADNPTAQPAGSFRVVRQKHAVTEATVVAASPAAARLAAMALPPEAWTTRLVLQKDGQDPFEYAVAASDF